MRRIKSKGMKPEMMVRRMVHGMGFRYRLHVRSLPGSPDLVFPRFRKVIFVHGCFWHQHAGCREGRIPDSRREYWVGKLEGNRERDRRHLRDLRKQGWGCLVLWECRILKNMEREREKILAFLRS